MQTPSGAVIWDSICHKIVLSVTLVIEDHVTRETHWTERWHLLKINVKLFPVVKRPQPFYVKWMSLYLRAGEGLRGGCSTHIPWPGPAGSQGRAFTINTSRLSTHTGQPSSASGFDHPYLLFNQKSAYGLVKGFYSDCTYKGSLNVKSGQTKVINGCWILSEAFSASAEMFIWFFSCLYGTPHWLICEESLYPWDKSHLVMVFSSVAQSCPTLCDPMDCSRPGFPVHHQLPELAETHVHRVGDTI